MLQCSMTNEERLKLALEDVLADLWHARRNDDLGRLVLVVHCDLRRWARVAGLELLAQRSQEFVLRCPHSSRQRLVSEVDRLIEQAEAAHARLCSGATAIDAGSDFHFDDCLSAESA
jgi:hypothetical protein